MNGSESAGLLGLRVVLTRPAEQAEPMATALCELGAQVLVRPLVAIAPPTDPVLLVTALAGLEGHDWIAFTSANAVRACVAAAPSVRHWPAIACVGTATAEAASAAGLRVALVSEVFTGAGLAASLLAASAPGQRRVLWPRASGASSGFSAVLRSAGATVTEVEAYRTVPDRGAAVALLAELGNEPADVLIFTSPSGVRTLAAVAGRVAPAAVAVIGTASAAAAEQAGWTVAVRPEQHTATALVAALQRWHRARGSARRAE